MKRLTTAVKISLRLAFLLAISVPAQPAPTDDAQRLVEEEAVRRANQTQLLHRNLEEAQAAVKRNQLAIAANLYLEAVGHIPMAQVGKPSVDADKRAALAGLDATEIALARADMANGDMLSANAHLGVALKKDPNNEQLRLVKAEIDQRTVEQAGRVPSPETIKRIPEVEKQKVEIATRVQNAKLLYEMGKLDDSEAILIQVIKEDPSDRTASYYLDLIKEARFTERARQREATVKSALVTVEAAWIRATNDLPSPNVWATTNLVYTTKGRQGILSKLDRMRLNEVKYNAVPLTEVLNQLRRESTNRDPDGIGINFMVNPYKDNAGVGGIAPTDITGAAAGGGPVGARQSVDMSQITITISPPMSDLRFADVLDAITKVAEQPIRYTVEDYAVVFSPKPDDQIPLYSKVFKVDPNTFIQGLQGVFAISLNPGISTGSSGGTGGGGGGGAAGGGGGGGGAAGGTSSTGATIPGVNFAPGATAGAGTGGAAALGGGGAGGGAAAGGLTGAGAQQGGAAALFNQGALNFVTRPIDTITLHQLVRQYFTAAGVDLGAGIVPNGKSVFFNDRTGLLYVRATEQDLEIIQQAIETLNQTPPQLKIESKFAELTQADSKGLGFNWYLGNTLMNNGALGLQGGTAPSYQGPSSTANPSGIFPGPGTLVPGSTTYIPGPGAAAPSATDNNLTPATLLRNSYGAQGTSLPTLATLTGIMTDPQFRVAINAIEQRQGNDLLSAPEVTTLSGRQAHIAAQDLQYIVTTTTVTETATTGGGLAGGSGVVAPSIGYSASPFSFGPVLDVLPTVSADGYSIQMTLIPTFTEFVGYDPPGQFVPTAQAVGTSIGVPLTAELPLPHFRVREVVTTCNVWDGQTVVLGGLIGETITKIKDKVPMLGDLPLVGRLFQSQSTDSTKENLLIFVTPTIVDPAGNRVHTDEDLPFAKSNIPPQPAPAAQ